MKIDMKKGTITLSPTFLAGMSVIFVTVMLLVGFILYRSGYFEGIKLGMTGVSGVKPCIYGSALITNHPEGLYCWNPGSKEVIFNYTAINSSDKEFGNGYLTIKADDGCLAYITVTAVPNKTIVLSVREASPNENFEDVDYEDYPVPPGYLAEGEALIYEYYPKVEARPLTDWANNTVVNLKLHVEIPEMGEPVPGCNRDVGDGVCEWDSNVVFRRLDWDCGTGYNSTTSTNSTNMTANCFIGDTTYTRFCSLNQTCAFQDKGNAIGGPSRCW